MILSADFIMSHSLTKFLFILMGAPHTQKDIYPKTLTKYFNYI